jgi:DNA primase catalytic core
MPWRIAEADIERVKRSTDLLALVQSRGIELKKHGSKDWIGRCPFHDDRDKPNFIVSPAKGLFHCMACGKAGNPIQFVEQHDGVSFRHAFELLNQGGTAAFAAQPLTRQSTVPRLPCPLDPEADDAALFGQVVAYYHERLKQSAPARAYLRSRGLDNDELITRFQLGFADRTLCLRLPASNREAGERLRSRLTQLGLWRESGHEHFNGCVVVPLLDEHGHVASLYGRRTQPGDLRHLYPPGPHRGLFNREALQSSEIILCEAVFDALTFYASGFTNVTCLFGTEGFTDELWEALRKVQRVKLAYDADEAGERAAQRDALRFQQHGVEVFRVRFPHGMDANEYARKVTPSDKSLALLLNSAAWLGKGGTGNLPVPVGNLPAGTGTVHDNHTMPALDATPAAVPPGRLPGGTGESPVPPTQPAPAPSLSLAASVSSLKPDAAKEEKPPPTAQAAPTLEQRGEAWFMDIEGREYRVAGLEKTLGTDALKVVLRLRVGERFHLDQVDLCRDAERRKFIERAAEETALLADLLKRDVARLLLAVEQAQAELAKPQEQAAPVVTLTPEERETANALLRDPKLVDRLLDALDLCGLAGETHNKLATYLCGVSRKLQRPLAVIIQSTSAAGKTTLMEAVLRFFPEEERVKYSAMTGQSLYYLGETSLKHKVLAIVEEEGAEKASYALKLLQSEGELTIASTGKDPATGRMVTQEYHVEGPAAICLTTTRVDLDEELQNRCLILSVDESREQTARIHALQRQARTLAGLTASEDRQETLKLFRNAQRLLQPWRIVNPFAEQLTFTTEGTRSRRDHEKYLTLIDSITLLHQHQRTTGQHIVNPDKSGQAARTVEFIEVALDDIALANRLAPEILARSRDELPPQTRRFLGTLKQLVRQRCAEQKLAQRACLFNRRELRALTGWSEFAVRAHLQRLEDLEYVARRFGRQGVGCQYELLMDANTPEDVAHIGLIDVESLRTATMRKGNAVATTPTDFVQLPAHFEPTSMPGQTKCSSPSNQALAHASMLRADCTSGGAATASL